MKEIRFICDGCGDTESTNGSDKTIEQAQRAMVTEKHWMFFENKDVCAECAKAIQELLDIRKKK